MEPSLSRTYFRALDRVLTRLDATKGQWNAIADEAQVAYTTVKHIAHGRIKQPNVEVLEALDRALSKRSGKQTPTAKTPSSH